MSPAPPCFIKPFLEVLRNTITSSFTAPHERMNFYFYWLSSPSATPDPFWRDATSRCNFHQIAFQKGWNEKKVFHIFRMAGDLMKEKSLDNVFSFLFSTEDVLCKLSKSNSCCRVDRCYIPRFLLHLKDCMHRWSKHLSLFFSEQLLVVVIVQTKPSLHGWNQRASYFCCSDWLL